MAKKQIIFIAGIFTSINTLNRWNNWLKELFPEENIIVIGENYSYFNLEKMKLNVLKLSNLIDSNKETILIGHSFGGIIINSALNNSKNNNVQRVISIFSPHKINYFGMKRRKEFLGYSEIKNSKIKVKSFGAYIDHLVPFFLSKEGNENSNHKNYWSDHYLELCRRENFFKNIILDGIRENEINSIKNTNKIKTNR